MLALFRPVLMLPHLLWAIVYDLLISVVLLASGLSILVLGKHPETLWEIMEGYFRYTVKVNAYALLQRHPDPTPEQIVSGMEGNLCRCGAHVRIVRAIQDAAAQLREEGGR